MILLSVTGVFRTILIICGIIFLMSLLGKMAQARRNVADEKRMRKEEEEARDLRQKASKNHGKVSITKVDKKELSKGEFTDFEEID